MRIVSLLPSATEIVCGLGLQDQLVGVTHECDFPTSVKRLVKVTTTRIPEAASSLEIDRLVREKLQHEKALYALNFGVLENLQPDLIVTQTLCDVCAVAKTDVQRAIGGLRTQPTIVNLEPTCMADLYHCIGQVADAANCREIAETYIDQLQQRVEQVARRSQTVERRPRVVMLEWIDPLFSAGHWNPELVELAGGQEVLGVAGARSRTISWQSLIEAAPDVLVIGCCGFPVQRTLQDLSILTSHPHWRALPCVQARQVYVIDGSAYFSRPGPRLIESLEIMAHTLHPQLHQLPPGIEPAFGVEQ